MKLQAKDRTMLDQTLENILDNLHLLGSGKFDLLKRRCGCCDLELAKKLKIIKSFDPKPGLQFSSEANNIREPDLKITKKDDGWLVTLNRSTLPSISINKTYAKTVRKSKMDDEQKEFIKEKIA